MCDIGGGCVSLLGRLFSLRMKIYSEATESR
jgi:hypothetical protein